MLSVFKKRSGAVKALIDTAMKAAEKAGSANYIHSKGAEGGSGIILTTYIKGEPLAWITYDAEQLDDLILMLQRRRAEL